MTLYTEGVPYSIFDSLGTNFPLSAIINPRNSPFKLDVSNILYLIPYI